MATKYWQMKVKGDPSADDIHRSVGESGGVVLRVHREKGETQVFFSGEEGKDAGKRLTGAGRAAAVKLDAVTKVG